MLLKNCKIGEELKDILIEEGKIKEIGHISGEGIDLGGKIVLPGLIDPHVHFREPGMTHKEDWKTGSLAAARGGYTTVFDMPNTNPSTTTMDALNEKIELAKKSIVNAKFHFGATKENFSEYEKSGLVLKIFMGSSTGNLLVDKEDDLDELFSKAKFVMVHAEDEEIINENAKRLKERSDPFVHSEIRSNKAAAVAVERAIRLAEKNGTILYVCHASTKEEIELIRDAKKRGVKVYCEVTPHHLFLDNNELNIQGNFAKMNPPLRSPQDVEALWVGVNDGTVDTIGTDHAPHLISEKIKAYSEAPAGVPGIENALSLMLDAVASRKTTLSRLSELMSENPAKIFQLNNKGKIEVLADADLTIVDLDKIKNVINEKQHTKCKWSPYNGMELKGDCVMTIVGGKVVYGMERYDVTKSFEYNKENGPFGYEEIQDKNNQIKEILGEYGVEKDFFGFKTKLPIGVAAGSLFNDNFMKAACKDGFEVVTWKTFRSESRLAHRNNGDYVGHNIVFVEPKGQLGTSSTETQLVAKLAIPNDRDKLTITNSFGMGSDEPSVWMPQVKEFEKFADDNNKLTISSCVGSPKPDWTIHDLANDYAAVAINAEQAGAKIIELNFSCPNVKGKEGSIYKSPENSAIICKAVKEKLSSAKLLIKIGYSEKEEYKELLDAVNPYCDGVVAINTVPMEIVDENGKRALPGGLKSGTCGYAIIDMSVKAVKSLVELRSENGYELKIIGCGGVVSAEAFMKHIDAGADFVCCATAALFNPDLPLDIAMYIRDNKINR